MAADASPPLSNTALEFDTNELVSLSKLPTPLIAGLLALLVIGVAFSGLATRGAPGGVRAGLLALRVLLATAIGALLLEPGLREMATTKKANRVVIAVDISESMQQDEGGVARIDKAASAVNAILGRLAADAGSYAPELVVFDGSARARALDAAPLARADAVGKESRLQVAVPAVDASASSPLGGVVVISDGADTSGLMAPLPAELLERVRALGAPVHAVAIGAERDFVDISLERASADSFAFVRNALTIEVVVKHRGFVGRSVPVTLKEDGRIVATGSAALDDTGETRVKLTHEPQQAGARVFTLETPVQANESIAENNRVDFALELIRDRIRVLQVAGHPSWDERFVRRLLKENPSVDLISFFILRTTTDVSGALNNELSLIPFPTRELFTEELSTFDVVIFQDFDFEPYNMGIYLQDVKRFVEESGGGFLMIGGDRSFSEGGYERTPIADVLPVELLPGTGHVDTTSFKPLLTPAGKTHPITDLGGLVARGESFEGLPPLEGVNLVRGLAPGAVSLLAHPLLNVGGSAHPVVAVREVGKGRTMAILTDSTWSWALPHAGAGGRGDAHRRFLANALRWLIRDPELSRVKIDVEAADEGGFPPGEPVPLVVRSFNERYEPEGGAALRIELSALDGGAAATQVITGTTGEDGVWRVPFSPPHAGPWRARVIAEREGRAMGSDEDAFVMRAIGREALAREPRRDLLAALAAAGEGQLVDVDRAGSLAFVDHAERRVLRQRTQPVWNRSTVLAIVLLLAGCEWWWRRRRGFA